jgi:hypothetical protein
MSDFQSLLLILAVLYLLESIVWVPDGALVFRRSLSGRWQAIRQGWRLAVSHGQLHLAPLLPPFGRILVAGASPLQIEPHSVRIDRFATGADAPSEGLIPFSSLRTVAGDGRTLLLNGKAAARLASPWSAQHAAALLNRVKAAREADRPALLQAEFRRSLDSEKARERLAAGRTAGRRLRIACYTEFGLLFVGLPVLSAWLGFRAILIPFLLCLLAMGVFIARQFHRAYKLLYEEGHPSRGIASAMLILSPLAAARAYDQLTEPALSDFHPLAVAGALFSPEDSLAETTRYVREWRFPLTGRQPAADWFHQNWQEALDRFVASNGSDLSRLAGSPPRESEECLSFCPRCASQYKFESGNCADCMLPVLRFENPASTA